LAHRDNELAEAKARAEALTVRVQQSDAEVANHEEQYAELFHQMENATAHLEHLEGLLHQEESEEEPEEKKWFDSDVDDDDQ